MRTDWSLLCCGAVDFDPLAGSKVKGISNAILVVEPHPFNVDETIVVVCTSSGEATIWHSADPRCSCLRQLVGDGPSTHGSLTQLASRRRRSQPRRLGKFDYFGQTMVGVGVNAVC